MDRIKQKNPDASIWEVTIEKPNPDFLKSPNMLSDFGRTIETILDEITKASEGQPINLYLAAPVACCIEFGRVWMQKANSPLNIYDYDTRVSKVDKLAITIKNKRMINITPELRENLNKVFMSLAQNLDITKTQLAKYLKINGKVS